MPRPLSPAEHKRRLKIYHETANDAAGGKAIGRTLATFRLWRESQGLPLKRDTRTLTPEEMQRRIEVLNRPGITQTEAAKELGLSEVALRLWRKIHGIHPPQRRQRQTRPLRPGKDQERKRVYDRTDNDDEAAKVLGMTPASFRQWRNQVGLPSKRQAALEQRLKLRRQWLLDGKSDEEVSILEGQHLYAQYRKLKDDLAELKDFLQLKPVRRRSPTGLKLITADQQLREILNAEKAWKTAKGKGNEVELRNQFLEKLGAGKGTIVEWRQRNLPQIERGPALDPKEHQRRRTAYNATANDIEAGALLDISHTSFTAWRITQHLPTKKMRPWHVETLRRVQAYVDTVSDVEATKKVGSIMPDGYSVNSWIGWRSNHELPLRHEAPAKLIRLLKAYVDAKTDEEGAKAAKVSGPEWNAFRKKHALPPQHPLLHSRHLRRANAEAYQSRGQK